MAQIIKPLASVFLCALRRLQFLFGFDEILLSGSGPKNKVEFVWGESLITPSSILPRFFAPLMHFQCEGSNTTVWRLEDL